MKNLFLFFVLTVVTMFNAYAAEDELLISAIEYDKILVNWNPQGSQLGRVLAYECNDCAVKKLFLNDETQLEDENGRALDIHELSRKVDWQGTIQTTNRDPDLIIKIKLQ